MTWMKDRIEENPTTRNLISEGADTMPSENLLLSDFSWTPTFPSQISPGATAFGKERLRCPACKEEQEPLKQGELRTCRCGLEMQAWGNSLYVRKF